MDSSSDSESTDLIDSYYKENTKVYQNTLQLFEQYGRFAKKQQPGPGILIAAGCDVRATDPCGYTLLHFAVQYWTVEQAEALLKLGADINAVTIRKETPLYLAVFCRRAEDMIAMLLYHNANVSICNVEGVSAFTTNLARVRTRHLLLPFQNKDDVVLMLSGKRTFFGNNTSQVLQALIVDGASVNCIDSNGNNPLIFSMKTHNLELFNIVWEKIDFDVLRKFRRTFLWLLFMPYMENQNFMPVDMMVQCLWLVMGSKIASDLISDIKALGRCGSCMSDFFKIMLDWLHKFEVDGRDRVGLIYQFLSLNATINIEVIDRVHRTYGNSEELEAVLQCPNFFCMGYPCRLKKLKFPMAHILCATEEDPTLKDIMMYFKREYKQSPDYIAHLLQYFTLSLPMKQDLLVLVSGGEDRMESNEASTSNKIREVLDLMPNVPSLQELSRNQTRKYLQRQFDIKKPYQFYNLIKRLNIPITVQNIICFKQVLH